MKRPIHFHLLLSSSLLIVLVYSCSDSQKTSSSAVAEDQIAYESDVRPIIRDFCTTCHRGANASADLDLMTYESVRKAAEHGPLLKRIMDADNPMPQGGLMPREERKTILLWAKNGFPKNRPDQASASLAPIENKGKAYNWTPPPITPVNLDEVGFDFMNQMAGHWVGDMNIMGIKYPWFCFDYRPISASHVHGIFEGGSMGNLFTSFFIADFKGTKTIMARNGGILQGIYRTSYFVLDKVEKRPNGAYYRLVDAYGNSDIMYMELTFSGNKLDFKSYTSRMGLKPPPSLHMHFRATKMHEELAQASAEKFGFPKNEAEWTFPEGMPTPNWGDEYPMITSASYTAEGSDLDILTLARMAGDPKTMADMPTIAQVQLSLQQNEAIKGKKLEVYLSMEPLTDENGKFIMEGGYIKESLYNGLLLFPELEPGTEKFDLTYLHPGDYYLTVIADMNGDSYGSKGDISSVSQKISLQAKDSQQITISDINHQN